MDRNNWNKDIKWTYIDCNSCIYLNVTEAQRSNFGLKVAPTHRCLKYNKRCYHNATYTGRDFFKRIFPCKQCDDDDNVNYTRTQ